MKKRFFQDPISIVFAGLLLRFLVVPFTMHWDFFAIMQITDKFDFSNLESFYRISYATFPPIMYLILKLYLAISGVFLGNAVHEFFLLPDITALNHINLYRILFFTKLPMILTEVLAGILFSKFFFSKFNKTVLAFWMFNPVIIFLSSVWTNVDSIPLLFMVLALVTLKKNRPNLSVLFLGISASFKLFSIFLLPFLVLMHKEWKKRFLSLTIGLIPLVFTHLPVFNLPAYYAHVFAGDYRQKIFSLILPLGGGKALIIGLLFYFLILYLFEQFKQKDKLIYLFFYLSLFPVFVFANFQMQWVLWLMPFVIILQSEKSLKLPFILFYLSYFSLILFSHSSLNIGMLAPLEITFWTWDYPIKNILGNQLDFLLNFFQTIFVSCLIFFGYYWYKNDLNNEKN